MHRNWGSEKGMNVGIFWFVAPAPYRDSVLTAQGFSLYNCCFTELMCGNKEPKREGEKNYPD